jgi:hypothetical protein
MNARDEETFARFSERFSRIDLEIPDPAPLPVGTTTGNVRRNRDVSRSSTAGLAVLFAAVVGLALIVGRGPTHAVDSGPGGGGSTSAQSPTLIASDSQTSAGSRWRVDVINRGHPVIVSVTTDTSAWAWSIATGEQRTLLDEAEAHPGGIEVMGEVEANPCGILGRAFFAAESFTLVLDEPNQGSGYRLTIEPGAFMSGPPNRNYTARCSG